MVQKQVILTSYFTSKEDPQQGKKRSAEDFSMMKGWYESLHGLGMNGIIFHDNLSEDFRKEFATDHLDFIEVDLGDRSPTDERFYNYLEYLESADVDQVIMTDLFDLEFKCNPFDLMENDYKLYMGDEPCSIRDLGWFNNKFNIKFYLPDVEYPDEYENYQVLNTGSIGGDLETIFYLLEDVLGYFYRLPPALNANMPVWNLVVRSQFDDSQIMHGEPWNSEFTGYENEGNFCIRHK